MSRKTKLVQSNTLKFEAAFPPGTAGLNDAVAVAEWTRKVRELYDPSTAGAPISYRFFDLLVADKRRYGLAVFLVLSNVVTFVMQNVLFSGIEFTWTRGKLPKEIESGLPHLDRLAKLEPVLSEVYKDLMVAKEDVHDGFSETFQRLVMLLVALQEVDVSDVQAMLSIFSDAKHLDDILCGADGWHPWGDTWTRELIYGPYRWRRTR